MKKLIDPTDDELNACFAEEVAGWSTAFEPDGWWDKDQNLHRAHFTQSADAVLPWLEKQGWRGTSNRAGSTCAATVSVLDDAGGEFVVQQDYTHTQTPFPRAAVIALLRSHGVEVEITAVW